MQEKLRLHCAPVQLPMGLEDQHTGLIDLIKMKAFHFKGPNGEEITEVHRLSSPANAAAQDSWWSCSPHNILGITDGAFCRRV